MEKGVSSQQFFYFIFLSQPPTNCYSRAKI